jgi:ABC-2 type transport system permease protein
MASMLAMMLAIFPAIRDNPEAQDYLESMPEALRELFGTADITSGTGYLQGELFSFMVPLLLVIMAVLWGSDELAGEEERGTLDLVLASPIGRRRAYLEQLASMTAGVVAVGVVVYVVIVAGSLLVGLEVGFSNLGSIVAATTVLTVLYGVIAAAVGAGTGQRGLARGLATVLAVAAYLVSALGSLADVLEPVRPLSPWWHALGVLPLETGWHPVRLLGVLALTVATAAAGAWAFDRRDVGV